MFKSRFKFLLLHTPLHRSCTTHSNLYKSNSPIREYALVRFSGGIMAKSNRADDGRSLSDAFLYITMCIIGLPVDVYISDGSIFSGIFHTTSVDDAYGIVLKKARMTKKGKNDGVAVEGDLVETLVISSDDLVQVVVKEFLFPNDGVTANLICDGAEAAVNNISAPNISLKEEINTAKPSLHKKKLNQSRAAIQNDNAVGHAFLPTKSGKENERRTTPATHKAKDMEVKYVKKNGTNIEKGQEVDREFINKRQVRDDLSQKTRVGNDEIPMVHGEKSVGQVQSSSPKNKMKNEVDNVHPAEEEHAKMPPNLLPNGVAENPAGISSQLDNKSHEGHAFVAPSDTVCSSVPTLSCIDVVKEPVANALSKAVNVAPSPIAESNKTLKEFKLNPAAKIFSPSFSNSLYAASSTTSSVGSMENITPPMPPAAAQSEVGVTAFAPRPSASAKFPPFNSLTTAGNVVSVSQFSQPIAGQVGVRTQPLRYVNPYHTQAGQLYMPSNSQAVMIGRLGQLVYMQPVPQDFVQGTAAISSMSAHPLLTTHQVQIPKHQGIGAQALQLSVPPPFVASGHQPFTVSGHVPILHHPIPSNVPLPVAVPNPCFNTKFA